VNILADGIYISGGFLLLLVIVFLIVFLFR
jgi:hypothetical protein